MSDTGNFSRSLVILRAAAQREGGKPFEGAKMEIKVRIEVGIKREKGEGGCVGW